MRQQQRCVFDALLRAAKDGTFDLRAEFLTFEDLLDCARKTANAVGVVNAEFNKNTVQTWLRSGVLRDSDKPDRTMRNRLYSTADVIRLATIMQLVHMGLRAKGAAQIADELVRALGTDWFYRIRQVKATSDLDARDFIYIVPGEKDGLCALHGVSPGSTKEDANKAFVLSLKRFGASIVVDGRLLVREAIDVTVKSRKSKLLLWRDKLKAELAKAQKKRG
jgi:DNA-binding transcriptional MerR regulator